ncbi:protein of unknown function [Taphrina deformans PYCC 5710]|uniref:Phenazine biosynthesis-like protein n=1 Tax=Taphrina deformans (strain PYCC 5710 / ATCC 11124 / CBS 356.35 / IMI 108563 / JCM 9778 / NBRC 8474) TaxID=1097556 RepID=R4XIB0_TAPDE|nr:protein of unknown function [Taphrina deformans PYCC 5710]|eukprot:CCG84239.1 protein of unknown function [Taphrina deformans PYCC 5710]
MVTDVPYEVLDVFTTQRYAGNPLAVVKLTTEDISQAQKQQIAKEFNLSETVFWHQYGDQTLGTRIDIFTPEAEIPFAGHPTIGSAVCVLEHLKQSSGTLLVKAGPIALTRPGDGYTYASIPHKSHTHAVQPLKGAAVVSIVRGMTFTLVEMSSREELSAQSKEIPLLREQLDHEWQVGLTGTYYYYRDPNEDDSYRCRMFTSFDGSGLEDAATGSAACTLAVHLADQNSSRKNMLIRIQQGVEIGRPSEILVKTERDGQGKIDTVVLGGRATRLMQGTLLL